MLGATAPNLRRQAAWFLASYAMAQGNVVEAHRMVCALGESERLNLLPLFPHDVAYDAELTRMALARDDDELVDVIVNLTERRAEVKR